MTDTDLPAAYVAAPTREDIPPMTAKHVGPPKAELPHAGPPHVEPERSKTAAPLLRIEDLHIEIPLPAGHLRAVRGVSMTVDAGESVGLVGESGSGKSLTLRALLGLLPHPARIVSGAIVVDGVDVTGLPDKRRREVLTDTFSMVFQDSLTALNPVMRIGDQVAEAPRHKLGMSRAAARDRAVELMRQVGIADPERRYRVYPHQLSGGLRQRICIAIALSTRPRVLLADEPTTALDVTIQAQVLNLIARLRAEGDLGLVFVSHDLAVIRSSCTRVYVMYAGRVVESGTVADVVHNPRHPYTFALLRAVPDPDEPEGRLLAIPGFAPNLITPPTGCGFAERCAFADAHCEAAEPALTPAPVPEHLSACLRWDTARQWPTRTGAAQ
ncbi:ABC transporter ATP-binding protein [Streptomyces sp. NPDC051554]|uniref:ABC transporter ATP-binding protein n=1 Tax=Streptomyces sp. NPDC051554 TaxID=3365656 RepID=UPI003791E590